MNYKSTLTLIAAIALVSTPILFVTYQQEALAQTLNSNPESTTQYNVWHFIFYIDHDNDPNTPPIRSAAQGYSRQECDTIRDRVIAQYQDQITAIDKCEMFKSPTQETEKFCFTVKVVSDDQIHIECFNTRQYCEFVRERAVAQDDIYEEVASKCVKR